MEFPNKKVWFNILHERNNMVTKYCHVIKSLTWIRKFGYCDPDLLWLHCPWRGKLRILSVYWNHDRRVLMGYQSHKFCYRLHCFIQLGSCSVTVPWSSQILAPSLDCSLKWFHLKCLVIPLSKYKLQTLCFKINFKVIKIWMCVVFYPVKSFDISKLFKAVTSKGMHFMKILSVKPIM